MNKLSIAIVAGAMSLTMGAANAETPFTASAQEWGPINETAVAGRHSRNLGSPFPAAEDTVLESRAAGSSRVMPSIADSANDD